MPNLHLGTIGWSHNFWKPNFYPPKTPSKDFLAYYASQFNTVEVDSIFYRIPTSQTVVNWKKQTSPAFKFSLKFPQAITHIKRLRDCQRETDLFLARAQLLEDKLGPLLLQFPPNFTADHMPELDGYLQKLPKQHRYVVEVRDKTWLNREFYSEISLCDELHSLLRTNKIAVAWVDSPNMPQILDRTADFLYIRWEGNRKQVNGALGKVEADCKDDLLAWAQKLKPYADRGMEVYGYFGKYYSGYPPGDVQMLQTLLTQDITDNTVRKSLVQT